MTNLKDFCGKLTRLLVPAIAFSVGGCGATGLSTNTTVDATETSDYTSPGGTSGLDLGESNNGTVTLKAFDPGAFVRATSQEEDAPADGDLLGSAQFDDGSGSHPPPDETLLPPPDETHLLSPDGTLLPPPDRTHLPPPDGTLPPPPDGGFFFMPPDGFTGELPPPLVLPFDFEGVLEASGTQ